MQQCQTHLVHEELEVVVCKRLRRSNDLMQVGVHELVDNIDVFEVLRIGREQKVPHANDVLMLQMSQQLDFTQGAPGVCQVFEGVLDLLDCYLLARDCILS